MICFFWTDWSRDGRNMRHINAKPLNRWVVVFPIDFERTSISLIDALMQICKPFGKIFFANLND